MRVGLFAASLLACHRNAAAPVDSNTPDSQVFPAPHPVTPQLVLFGGGPVMASPLVVQVTFKNDPWVADLDSIATELGPSAYWSQIAAEYGVGSVGAAPAIHVAVDAPMRIDEDGIRAWLASQLDGTHPEWGTPDPRKVYSLFYPKTTRVVLPIPGPHPLESCIDYNGGWHNFLTIGAMRVVYTVTAECDTPQATGAVGLNAATLTFSHELIEAATDPYGTGYFVDQDHYAYIPFTQSGETGDLCEMTNVPVVPPDLGYTVTRSWSNMSARAGHASCVPALPEPYFNSAPVLTDDVSFQMFGEALTTKGVRIPVGGSATVELDLFSDAPTTGPWQVSAIDLARIEGRRATLRFAFDRATGQNGDKLRMTIDVLGGDPDYAAEPFVVASKLGTTTNTWLGIVGN
jgi:hypothetical protein